MNQARLRGVAAFAAGAAKTGAARGLLLSALFGMSPLSKAEHDRLFARLLDDQQWTGLEQPAKEQPTKEQPTKARAAKSGGEPAPKAATPRKRA